MRDTGQDAAEVQTRIYRKFTGSERLARACELSRTVRNLALARLRRQHPEWSEVDLKRELIRYAFLPDEPPPPFR